MTNIEFDIDPLLKDRGHSAAIQFRCPDGDVSVGGTNEGCYTSHYRVVIVHLTFAGTGQSIRIRGGDAEYEEWRVLEGNDAKRAFMWAMLIRNLDADRLKAIIDNTMEAGMALGRSQLQLQFAKLMGC